MRYSENKTFWLAIILLFLCSQIYAKGGRVSHFGRKTYLPPEFAKIINAPDFDVEAFRITVQDPKLETYRSYKGNGTRYIKARNARNGLNGKAFEAITQSKFNHYAKSTPELKNFKIASSAHFEKAFTKPADEVVDLMLVDISNPRMQIVEKYQLKFSLDEAKKALKNPKYKNTKIVVPSDVYKEMSRKTQYLKAIEEGRLCRDIMGVEVPETKYVKKLAQDYMQEIFTDLNELEKSGSGALTSEAIAQSSKKISERYVSKVASSIRSTVREQASAAHRSLSYPEIITFITDRTDPPTRLMPAPKNSSSYSINVSSKTDIIDPPTKLKGPKSSLLKSSLKVVGKSLVIADIAFSNYLIVNDVKKYNTGDYDVDIFIGKTILHSASLATGVAFICAPDATVTKIAGVVVLVAGIPTELAFDYVQNIRLKKQLAALNSQEQHNAIRNSLINAL